MTKVTFEYDETTRKWEVFVEGVEDETEAVQAFNAVLLTAQTAAAHMAHRVKLVDKHKPRYEIIVGL